MSLQQQFNKFEEKIKLTWSDDKLKTIREKDESIRSDIRDAFKEKGYPVKDFFQQGSYATKTTIVPLNDDYDIDVGVVIDNENAPEDPVEVKKTLRDILVARNFKEPKIKMPCVTAQYLKSGEKHFHLDYPVYKKQNNNYFLAVGKEYSNDEQKSWEESDPKGLLEWLKNPINSLEEIEIAQYRRIIKYLKRWRDFKFSDEERKKVYSIGLAVMVGETFIESITTDGDISDIDSLKETINAMLPKYFTFTSNDSQGNPQYEIKVNLPKQPYRDIFTKHGKTVGTIIQKRLTNLKDKLATVIEESSLKKQCEILANDVFGDDFPIPDNDSSDNKKFKEAGFVASPQGA